VKAWYLIYTKPRQERIAVNNLERQGYHTYLPLLRQRRRRAGRYSEVVEALFPRYLFIHLDEQTDNWAPIRSTLGVSGLVRFGGMPSKVPDPLIDMIRASADASGIQQLPEKELKPGDKVRIREGAMAGYEAVFSARTSKERVILLLEIAGKTAQVKLSRDAIEPGD